MTEIKPDQENQQTQNTATENPTRWQPGDAVHIAELLECQYSEKFQKEFEEMLQNSVYKKWVENGNNPIIFARTFFDISGPKHLKLKPSSIFEGKDTLNLGAILKNVKRNLDTSGDKKRFSR